MSLAFNVERASITFALGVPISMRLLNACSVSPVLWESMCQMRRESPGTEDFNRNSGMYFDTGSLRSSSFFSANIAANTPAKPLETLPILNMLSSLIEPPSNLPLILP